VARFKRRSAQPPLSADDVFGAGEKLAVDTVITKVHDSGYGGLAG
jgi:hypothetical protein